MSDKKSEDQTRKATQDWWRSEIIDMQPGEIRFRGFPIEDLIGAISFPQMIWLMLRGDLPSQAQATLLEAALVAAVDHGPQAPSIAAARMAATCGVGLNAVMATGLNMLGDVHGGAGEQAVLLYHEIAAECDTGLSLQKSSLQKSVEASLQKITSDGGFVPGFGHRFHPIDPRAPRLLKLVDDAVDQGIVTGTYARIATAIETTLEAQKGKRIPMNIDGATAVIFAELGFAPPLARGLFCLSRAVGVLAHGWEQTQQGGRNKGPIPRDMISTYEGPKPRGLDD